MNLDVEYQELWRKLLELPMGIGRLMAVEQIINLADSNNDLEVAYQMRMQLVRLANNTGYPDKAIVAFSWCLSQMDKTPEIDRWDSVLHEYKVIQEWIPVFAGVSRNQIVKMQEDFCQRALQLGFSERTPHYYRSWNYMRMGEYDLAHEHQEKYLSMTKDGLADCKACEKDRQVELLSRMKRDEEALEAAKPIMSFRMRCGEVPQFTYAHICKSLIRTGSVEKAAKQFPAAYNIVKKERKYLGTIGDLLLVLIRVEDLDQAFNCAKSHMNWAAETAAEELKFRFFSPCALLFEAIGKQRDNIRLALPKEFDCYREDGDYSCNALAKWFAEQTTELAARFNQRNGNTRYDEMLIDNRELAGLS